MDSGVDSDSTGLKDWVKPKGCVCVWGGYDWNMKDEKSEQWAKQRKSATCSWTVICFCLSCQFSPWAVSHHWCYLCSLKTLLISLSPRMLCNMNAKWYLQIIIDYWQSQHFRVKINQCDTTRSWDLKWAQRPYCNRQIFTILDFKNITLGSFLNEEISRTRHWWRAFYKNKGNDVT